MNKFNYIIAAYFGKRRTYNLATTEVFLDVHLSFFEKYHIYFLNKIIIVLNSCGYDDLVKINIIKNKYKNLPLDIIVKDNIGGSYYNYEIGILNSLFEDKHIDYTFIFEDDYVPNDLFFYKPFFEKMKDDVFYVCQSMADEKTWEDIYGKSYAGLSNGLIDLKKVRKYYKEHGKIFKIDLGSEYSNYSINQVFFTDYLREDYTIDSLKYEYCHPVYGVDYFYYLGNIKGKILIRPIFFNSFNFIKNIRNEDDYIINSTSFDIIYDNKTIGYFNISNYSHIEKSVNIECSTSNEYLMDAYINFINFISFKTNIENFYINSNEIEKYEELGFKKIDDNLIKMNISDFNSNQYNINLYYNSNEKLFYLDNKINKKFEFLFSMLDMNNNVIYSALNLFDGICSYWYSIGDRILNYDFVKVVINDKNNFIYEKVFEIKNN